ncbi:MAG: domain S-box protein [Mucilaginibacter sp.]|nr:domain S-box protein [Mucilaginibacter sp.]
MISDKTHLTLDSLGLFVADHVPAILGYWDKDLVCRFANAAYREWFGKSPEEMVDILTSEEVLGSLYKKNKPYILGALAGKPQIFEREITFPNGDTRHTIISYTPDIDNCIVKGFFVHIADITKVKLLERELTKSNEIIVEQNKRLLNFANIVSHNLKTYAYNLGNVLDLLINADSEEEKNLMVSYLKSISKGFNSTVSNLNEIADAHNQGDLKAELIYLHGYIDNVIKTLQIQTKSLNASIRNNVNADLSLFANPAYMESILLNFLTNAIKYRHPNRAAIIEFDVFKNGNYLVLSIKDNGIGINLEKHGKDLFGMYKTFHGNMNIDSKGIGLFITKFQVETMGGYIEVESEVNIGTTFKIHFSL